MKTKQNKLYMWTMANFREHNYLFRLKQVGRNIIPIKLIILN